MSTPTPERITRTVVDGARHAGRSTFALLRDSGYATIGATDAAVAYARAVQSKATEARGTLRGVSLPTATDVSGSLRELSAGVEEQFEALAGRGREVVGALQGNRATREAVDRADSAQSRVKAAATSVGRAGAATGEAVEQAVETVGERTRADYEAMTVEELRALARARDIEGRSDMNKAELVDALSNA